MKKFLIVTVFFLIFIFLTPVSLFAAPASSCTLTISVSSDGDADMLCDENYYTEISLSAGDTITITSSEPFASLYIEWGTLPCPWLLTYEGKSLTCGQNSFLHEYVALETPATHAVLTAQGDMTITGIKAYSEGTLPPDVQIWEPPCSRADILLFSSHADDEILFLGGIIPIYAGERKLAVQVVYFTRYQDSQIIREHEKLDGLWTAGIRNYPVDLGYPDYYSETLEQAMEQYNYDEAKTALTNMLKRFQPQVAVGQDFQGEYGHGAHMFTAKLLADAAVLADVPKIYFHVYPENPIVLDVRTPLTAFDGQTALEVAIQAYKKHVSQQWCWFYVSDENTFACNRFGLYHSTVGPDTQNDLMEHLISYEEQNLCRISYRNRIRFFRKKRHAITPMTFRREMP